MAVDRHINFFEFQKACEASTACEADKGDGPRCPLCRIVSDRAERYIDNMLFEHVSDRGFRAMHRRAGGFCAFHSRNLVSFRDGLAVAILGRDILEERIAHYQNRKPWKPEEPCPVCAERERIEVEYLSFLAQLAETDEPEEADLRRAYLASGGLCAPHYGMLLELCWSGRIWDKLSPAARFFKKLKGEGKRPPKWLRTFEETKFEKLKQRIDTFIDLSAYGRQAEFNALSEADQLVWKELAQTLRGSG